MNINCLSLLYLAAFPLKPMIILRGATSVTQELSLLMIHFWPIPTLSPVYHFPGHTVPCEAVPVSALSAVSQAPFSACQGAMQDYRFSKECHCHPELPQQSCSLSCCQNRGTAWFGTPWSSLEIEETWTSLGDSWKKKKSIKELPTLKIKCNKNRKREKFSHYLSGMWKIPLYLKFYKQKALS